MVTHSPAISFASIATDAYTDELLHSLRTDGCCRLLDAIPRGLDERALTAAQRLFALPDDVKLKCRAVAPDKAGYSPYGVAHALDSGIPNLLESWTIATQPITPVPGGYGDARKTFAEIDQQLRYVAQATLSALDTALAAAGELERAFVPRDSNLFLLHYPRHLIGRDSRAVRQSLHVDSSIITVTPRATAAGLVVSTPRGLIRVSLAPSEVLVLAGSLIDYMTRSDITGCRHTVETPDLASASDRTSMVYFAAADPAVTLRPLTPSDGQRGAVDKGLSVGHHEGRYAARVYPRGSR